MSTEVALSSCEDSRILLFALEYADNVMLLSECLNKLQVFLDLSISVNIFGMHFDSSKCMMSLQGSEPNLILGKEQWDKVDNFGY